MKTNGKTAIRLAFYLGGLLIMTLGVAISVKSGLGVTPLSSIPYTVSIVFGIELGLATMIVSVILALIEIPVLRSQYKVSNLLQIPVSIVFGFFMTTCNKLAQSIPSPDGFIFRFVLMLISTVIVAVGVFMYVSSGFVPLPTEGLLLAIAQVTKVKFPTLKLIGDISMVAVSLTTCLIAIHQFGSIGIGTIVSALLVGNEVKILTRYFGNSVKKLFS